MHIMESLLSTTDCRKSTKNSIQASCSGPLRAAKKHKKKSPGLRRWRAGREQGHLLLRLRRPSSRSLALIQPCAFSSAIYSCLGDLATCFTCLHQSKQAKSPRDVRTRGLAFKHACSLSCMQHTPACITCMHSRSTQLRSPRWWLLLSSCSGRLRHVQLPWTVWFVKSFGTSTRSGNGPPNLQNQLFAILPAASSSRRSTKHRTSDRQWRRRYGVCCWLRMKPTIITTLSPKAHRCLKQAHRRRIEATPLPSPTQTRLNTCQLQVYMIY